MTGIVADIQLAPFGGANLGSVSTARLVPGKGISGDRYFNGNGTFSDKLKGRPDSEVTLIEKEEIDAFNTISGLGYAAGDFRRNIVTEGVRLNALVGKTFRIGSVQLKGIRLCEPCAHLSSILGNEIMEHMVHKAGLRAQVLSEGEIFIGDQVSN